MGAREEWLKCGDKNTKWFHSKATQRKKRNEIKGIFKSSNTWVESVKDIGSAATDYFKTLLCSSQSSKDSIKEVIEAISKRILDFF